VLQFQAPGVAETDFGNYLCGVQTAHSRTLLLGAETGHQRVQNPVTPTAQAFYSGLTPPRLRYVVKAASAQDGSYLELGQKYLMSVLRGDKIAGFMLQAPSIRAFFEGCPAVSAAQSLRIQPKKRRDY
jgi:hypothetical protein